MFDGFIHDLRIFGDQFYRLGGFHGHALQGIGLHVSVFGGWKRVTQNDKLRDFQLPQDGVVAVDDTFVLDDFQELRQLGFRVHVGIFAGYPTVYSKFQITARNELFSGVVTTLHRGQHDVVFRGELYLRTQIDEGDQPVFAVGLHLAAFFVVVGSLAADFQFDVVCHRAAHYAVGVVLLLGDSLLLLDELVVLSLFVDDGTLRLGFEVFVPLFLFPVFDIAGIRAEHAVGRLAGELNDGTFQDVAVLGEVMYGTVLKLRESQTDDATGGIADVAAQSAMRKDAPAQKRRGTDIEQSAAE